MEPYCRSSNCRSRIEEVLRGILCSTICGESGIAGVTAGDRGADETIPRTTMPGLDTILGGLIIIAGLASEACGDETEKPDIVAENAS